MFLFCHSDLFKFSCHQPCNLISVGYNIDGSVQYYPKCQYNVQALRIVLHSPNDISDVLHSPNDILGKTLDSCKANAEYKFSLTQIGDFVLKW